MSTSINQYLIYGVKLPYQNDAYEAFDRFCDSAHDDKMNPNGLHCLYDGMNGDYIYIGRCLYKSKEGKSLPDLVIEPISEDVAELTRLLIKAELGIEEPMQLHLVTHHR